MKLTNDRPRSFLHVLGIAAVVFVLVLPVLAQRAGGPGPANPFQGNQQAIDQGRELYDQSCTDCHGKDGAGADLGPPLAAPNRRYLRRTDAEIFDSITKGIEGTQMPPFKEIPESDAWKITAYIHGLRGTAVDAPTKGDVAKGEQIFWGKAQCGSCHMVRGKGGLSAPDLSDIAGQWKVSSIVTALTKAQHRIFADGGTHDAALLPLATYQPVQVTMNDGRKINGILRNEDSFSMQVLASDGSRIYLVDRGKVKEVAYAAKTTMPTDFDKRLTPDEFQDLMAYLTRLALPRRGPGGAPAATGD